MIDEKDIAFNEISKKEKEFLESYDLKLVSINEPITEDNKNNTFIMEEYNPPYSPDGVNIIKSTHLVKITDFKWKNQNSIHIVLQKQLPEDTVFTGIKIKSPKGALFGNIKCYGNLNGTYSYSKTIIQDAELFPLFSMPIETNPSLRILQYWFGKSFLTWNIAKNYIKEKDILSLVEIKDNNPKPKKQAFKNARISFGNVGWKDLVSISGVMPPIPERNSLDTKLISDSNVERVYAYGGGNIPLNTGYLSTPPDGKYGDVVIEFAEAPVQGTLQDVLKDFLTYRYNYDRKFPGAKYDDKGNPVNDSAILRQKFESAKTPEDVIDGLFEEWKFNNPTYLDKEPVECFKQIVYMLSNYTYTKLAINKGYNDDIKVLSPYYFKLISRPVEKEEGYWEFNDCIVTLQSLYFNFVNENKVNIKNKNISSNQLYKLEANYYNWLSITNELESNKIPSLIPGEIKLNYGEYGKYLVSFITKDIEKCFSLFSNINDNIYSKSDFLDLMFDFNETDFNLHFSKELKLLKQIEISGIWMQGIYNISIITNSNLEININNLQLFNENNELLSLISLEI